MNWQRAIRKALRTERDINAIRRGPKAMVRRAGRRMYGKATGRLAARLFK